MLKLRKFLESLHFCPGHQLSMESQEAEWVGRAPEKGVRMLKQEGNYKTREMFHPSTQPHTPLGWEKADAWVPPQPDFSLVFYLRLQGAQRMDRIYEVRNVCLDWKKIGGKPHEGLPNALSQHQR